MFSTQGIWLLVNFLIALTRFLTINSLNGTGFIFLHSGRVQCIIAAKTWQLELLMAVAGGASGCLLRS